MQTDPLQRRAATGMTLTSQTSQTPESTCRMISLPKVQQQAKLIYGVRRRDRGPFGGGGWGVAEKGKRVDFEHLGIP